MSTVTAYLHVPDKVRATFKCTIKKQNNIDVHPLKRTATPTDVYVISRTWWKSYN